MILKKGSWIGFWSAIVGSFVFAIFEFGFFDLLILFIFTVIGSLLAFLPGLFGGRFLAYLINKDAKKGKLSTRSAFIKGALLGTLAGFGISLLVLIPESSR